MPTTDEDESAARPAPRHSLYAAGADGRSVVDALRPLVQVSVTGRTVACPADTELRGFQRNQWKASLLGGAAIFDAIAKATAANAIVQTINGPVGRSQMTDPIRPSR